MGIVRAPVSADAGPKGPAKIQRIPKTAGRISEIFLVATSTNSETMVSSIQVPDNYGYVFFACGVLPAVANLLIGGKVMGARKTYNVQYPNLYATPGYHKSADEFNRVQRGHQHIFESLSDFRAVSFIGGLAHPLVCAGCGVVYCLGNALYMAGYADNKLDVKVARLKKGGPISMLAFLVSLGCATKFSISLIKG